MTSPAFTAILAAFNEEDWVSSAIGSVLAQTRTDFELVVVDDGSTDATAEVVRTFQPDPRVRLISQENTGLAGALKTGIAASTAPYVALIDADDLWMPTYLEGLGRTLDENPKAGFAYTDAWCMNHATGRFWRISSNAYLGEPNPPPADPEEFLRLLLERNFVFGLTTIRRSAFDAVGGFDESLKAAEDYELWLRLLARGYEAARAPGRLAVTRDRGGAMHTDERNMLMHLREVYRIVAEDLETSDEVSAIARRRMRETDAQCGALDEGPLPTARKALRRRLGSIYKATFGRDFWYPGIPPEVARAFPDLAGGAETEASREP
ncbi:MAG: glycosyltransferase family A protein [Solirubrobacterales bacterium]